MAFFRASTLCLAAAAVPADAALADALRPPPAIDTADGFKLSGSLRVRYETLDGQPRAGFRASDQRIALRTALLAEYRDGPFRIGTELFDSRVYLDKADSPLSTAEVNALEPVQAYIAADLGDALGQGSSTQVQVGRMVLNLGSRRLVAADEFRNTTNGYTGIRADLKARDGTTATLIYTLPQLRLPDDLPSIRRNAVQWDHESFDLRLWGGVIARPRTIAGATAELSYFRLQERDSPSLPTRDRNLHTVAARIIRDPQAGRWDFEAEAAYQFGSVRASAAGDAVELEVDAWFVHVDAGYSFPGSAKLRLSVEYDEASGDGRGRGFSRFDTLFGMRRADFAASGIYSAIGRANIRTPGLRVELAPTKRLDAYATYRAMWLANRTDAFSTTGVRDASGKSGSFAGHQIEGRLRYWLRPGTLRGEVYAAWLAKGRFLKTAPNAPRTGDSRYLATALTASF